MRPRRRPGTVGFYMVRDPKSSAVLAILTLVFAAMAAAFWRLPAVSPAPKLAPLVSPDQLAGIKPPGTVRISAAQLVRSGGDASGLNCYACHHRESPPEVKFEANGRIILPKEHLDLIISMRNCSECHPADDPVKLDYADDGSVIMPKGHQNLAAMAHGRNFRNENCYNCHDRNQLDRLHTADGTQLRFDQATQLCASCHGPTYRDWLAGVHGRTNGVWDTSRGALVRQECASCHDPHAPAFTGLIPMPGPHRRIPTL
jgi:hypothetical protein